MLVTNQDLLNETDKHEETQAVGSVKTSVYKSYIGAVGSFPYIGFVAVMFIIAQGLVSGVDYYISQW